MLFNTRRKYKCCGKSYQRELKFRPSSRIDFIWDFGTRHLKYYICIFLETVMLHFDHFETMEKSNIKQYTMNPPWDNTCVDSTTNNKYSHYKEYIEKSGRVEFPFDLNGTLMKLNINTVFLNVLFNADTRPDKEKHNKHFCEQVKYGSNETE